jgi:hypothetical protein
VQRALYAGAVIAAEATDTRDDVFDIDISDLGVAENYLTVRVPGFGGTTQVQDYFQQFAVFQLFYERLAYVRRQDAQQRIQIVSHYSLQ